MTLTHALGPLMIDIASTSLSADDQRRLRHPMVGGIILFRRNYQNLEQIRALCQEIKALRQPELIIAVDHEGGRVQRFIEGFTRLPAMALLGQIAAEQSEDAAKRLAENIGHVLAVELRTVGVDLSFTPVLDRDYGHDSVIGDRSFDHDPMRIASLATALQKGLLSGGMAACGKHFPGHGFVTADSHLSLPCDQRCFDDIFAQDLPPFAELINTGLAAIMPAHVLYHAVDNQPAGYSEFWLKRCLRETLGFDGIVFSDDLAMAGAAGGGRLSARAQQALAAGCDIALVCNQNDAYDALLEALTPPENIHLARRWERVRGQGTPSLWQAYAQSATFKNLQNTVSALTQTPTTPRGTTSVGETVID